MLIAALAFIVVSTVKMLDGQNYLQLSTSLLNSLAFILLAWGIYKAKINFNEPNDGLNVFFPIGFVFAIAGSSGYLNSGIWGFGITLIIVGLFFSPKEKEELKEDQNAG